MPFLAAVLAYPIGGDRFFIKLGLVFAIVGWAALNWNKPGRLLPAEPRWLPGLSAISVIALYSAAGILEFRNYSNHDTGDLGCYLSFFGNSTGWLPGPSAGTGRPLLAIHSEFYCIPLGWLFNAAPLPLTLQLVQAVFAILSWFLFRSWIVGKCQGNPAGEWLAFGFALTPCLLSSLLKGFHGVVLAMPFLVVAATAFYDAKWKRFLAFLCLLLLAKEIFTFTAIAMGGAALIQRRPWKWVVVPIALGLGYGLILRFWYFPMMLKDVGYYFDSGNGQWREILPRIFSGEGGLYVVRVLLWGGTFAALCSPIALLALPSAGLNLYLGHGFINPINHYMLEPAFWLYFAAVAHFLKGMRPGKGADADTARRIYAFLACLVLLAFSLAQALPAYRHHPLEKSYRKALSEIPADATVSLGVPLDSHIYFVHRFYWPSFGGNLPGADCTWADVFGLEGRPGEYVLLHQEYGVPGYSPGEKDHIRKCWPRLLADSAYAVAWEDSVLILLRKRD